jgi:hypothetical protein
MSAWAILGVLALAAGLAILIAVLIAAGFGAALSRRRDQCPACGERRLKREQFILATVSIKGVRAPDNMSYWRCEACQAQFTQHRDGALQIAPEEEIPS